MFQNFLKRLKINNYYRRQIINTSEWQNIDKKSYNFLIKDAEILTEDLYGYKVIKLKNGSIAKLFRLKRILSSALIWPYAKRFVRGVSILKKYDIPTVTITGLYKVNFIKRDMVIYRPLKGESLRDIIKNKHDAGKIISEFASFFAQLHRYGIYFRSIHFNNVFITQDRRFGLIDVADLNHSFIPFTLFKRARNFKPIFRYEEDRSAIDSFSLDNFVDIYYKCSEIKSERKKATLKKMILRFYNKQIR